MRIVVRHNPVKFISKRNIAAILQLAALATDTDRPGREIVVGFIDDQAMRALNKRYRKIDRVTDILSFSYWSTSKGPVKAQSKGLPFGELVIATDQVTRQAHRLRHSFGVEVGQLLIHGYLHLLGHDHHKPSERQLMRTWEDKISRRLRRTAHL